MKRWRGSKALLFDTVEKTTTLVEEAHASAARKSFGPLTRVGQVAALAQAVEATHNATAAGVYKSIRAINRSVEKVLAAGDALAGGTGRDARPDNATPLRSDARGSRAWVIDQAESALNGFWGDYLSERQNSLDLDMSLRHEGRVLPPERAALARALPAASSRLAVFVHGLSSTEWTWSMSAERHYGDPTVTYGSRLHDDLGYTPLYVRYNSGRRVSTNGRALSALLAQLVAGYPMPVGEIVLVGHSMGGLVARSAAYYGHSENEPWVSHLRHVFCLGTPNLGAPLEKSVNVLTNLLGAVDLPGTQVPAQVLNARSVGIKDLRYGYTLDEEWQGKDPDALLVDRRQNAPLVDGVGYYFVSATLTEDPAHPLGLLLGDLLVRPRSAAGQAAEPARRIPFRAGRAFNGLNHFQLTNHPDVYPVIRQCIEDARLAPTDYTIRRLDL